MEVKENMDGGSGYRIAAFSLGLAALAIAGTWARINRKKRMLQQNYRWYRTTFPNPFRRDRVTCHNCKSDHIHVRNVVQGKYMRIHFCSQCGTTLYYSPEGSLLS